MEHANLTASDGFLLFFPSWKGLVGKNGDNEKEEESTPPMSLSFFLRPLPPLTSTLKNSPMMTIIKKTGYIYDLIFIILQPVVIVVPIIPSIPPFFGGLERSREGGYREIWVGGVRFRHICGTETRGYTNISS